MEPEEVLSSFIEDIKGINDLDSLEKVRIKYLGKKGIIQSLFNQLKIIPPEQKPIFGKKVNDVKEEITRRIEELKGIVSVKKIEKIDKTIPGIKRKKGSIHGFFTCIWI
jgi:phenylalanyl-tRNA synthetase alpha chain